MIRRRAQRLLGLTDAEAQLLTARARGRLGRPGYSLRAAAFAIATTPVLRRALPRAVRVRAIRPLVYGLLPGPTENLLYAARMSDGPVEANH